MSKILKYRVLEISMFCVLVLFSCNNIEKKRVKGTIELNPKNDIVSVDDFFDLDSIEIIPITCNNGFIYHLTSCVFFDDKIIALDSKYEKKIYIINIDGELESIIDGFGNGPEEYSSIGDIAVNIDDSLIYVNDALKATFLKFDLNSNFVSKEFVGYNFKNFLFSNSNEIYCFTVHKRNKFNDEIINYDIIGIDKTKHNIKTKLYPFKEKEIGISSTFMYYLQPWYQYQGMINYTAFGSDSVVNITNGNSELRFLFDKGKYKYLREGEFSDEYVADLINGDIDEFIINVVPRLESTNVLLFTYLFNSKLYYSYYNKESYIVKSISVSVDINMGSELCLFTKPFYEEEGVNYCMISAQELLILFDETILKERYGISIDENKIDQYNPFIFKYRLKD